MTQGEGRARFSGSSRSGATRREMTVGEIFDWMVETDGELAVTPWRRGQREKLRAAVEVPGLW